MYRVTKFDPQAQMESSKVAEIRFSFSSISNTVRRATKEFSDVKVLLAMFLQIYIDASYH